MNDRNNNWDFIITDNSPFIDFQIGEILRYQDLLWLFVKRDFTTFYKQTILGPLWFFIQPLITTLVFYVAFNRIAKISTDQTPPILFYMSAIIIWNYFTNCLNTTAGTFKTNAGIFGKVYFPRLIVPLSMVISGLAKFFVQFLLFLGFYLFYLFIDLNEKIELTTGLIIFIPLMVLQMAMLGQGLGMIISSLTIKYRDLSYLISFGTQLMMYASPIIYPLSSVPENYKIFIQTNPVTPIIEGFRFIFLGNGLFDISLLFISFIMTLAIFTIGLILFNKAEKSFIDTI